MKQQNVIKDNFLLIPLIMYAMLKNTKSSPLYPDQETPLPTISSIEGLSWLFRKYFIFIFHSVEGSNSFILPQTFFRLQLPNSQEQYRHSFNIKTISVLDRQFQHSPGQYYIEFILITMSSLIYHLFLLTMYHSTCKAIFYFQKK